MTAIVEKWLALKNWSEPNITQKKAIDSGLLADSKNLVVIAPTASGKTGVAELATMQMLESKKRVVYLVPSKVLVSEKERDFSKLLQNYNATCAGEKIENWDKSDLVISTFELFYRTALTKPDVIRNFSLAIIDEFHLLYDKLRGFNLEKVITIIKEFNMRIICLSATFEDKQEIADWLSASIVEVPEEARAVQIKHGIIPLKSRNQQNGELCAILIAKSQIPYIVFCASKESSRIRALEMFRLLQVNATEETRLLEIFERILGRKQLTELEQELLTCLSRRVGFHHSEIKPELKNLVEQLYCGRRIDYLFATTGLAYGVNFPAKTVVLSDLSFFDPNSVSRRSDIPVFMYKQMAGRAGRPGLETEAYSYVVTKNPIEEQYKAKNYIEGKIEKAKSQIGHDEYFRKAILELIYSGRNTDSMIQKFFESTFYHFQSNRVTNPFIKYDLHEIIGYHMAYLHANGLLTYLGAPGYKLTDFGNVVVGFLFWSFSSYELAPFVELKKFLDKEQLVQPDFELLHLISNLFDGACLSKIPRKTSPEIEEYYTNSGVTEVESPEYSAYALFFGWMENMDDFNIEDKLKVNSSQLPLVANEMFKLLKVYETLARKTGYNVDPTFKTFCDRVRYGVTEDELPFVKLKQIGRGTARELNVYSKAVLRRLDYNYKGPLVEVYKQLLKDVGDDKFLNTHLKYVPNVGPVRSKIILDFVKQSE
jgi:helicase